MTDKEKEAIVKAAYPDISGADLDWAKHLVEKGDTAATYKKRIYQEPHMLKQEVPLVGLSLKGGKVVADLIKSVLSKKAAGKTVEEIAAAVAKKNPGWSQDAVNAFAKEQAAREAAGTASTAGRLKAAATWAKNNKIKTGLGVAGLYAVNQGIANSNKSSNAALTSTDQAAQSQNEADLANAIATYNATGGDVSKWINTSPTAAQLGITANNVSTFMQGKGYGTALTGIGAVGIPTGKTVTVPGKWIPGLKVGSTTNSETKPETVSLAEWKKQFPITDAKAVAVIKQKFVNAGVISNGAGVEQVMAAWEKYGQMSLDAARAGTTITPWALLDLNKGLSGGGSGGSSTSVTIDESPMAASDITTILKRQMQQSLGLTTIDDKDINAFIAKVRAKEKKSPTKTTVTTVGNKTTRKTVQGYGGNDVLADAEAYAKTNPMYSQFQTANVFGDALNKALGN